MVLAIALIVIVAGSLLFHYFSPWWQTPLASNWSQMDDTLFITFLLTGIFFTAVILFLAYTLVRFTHRAGGRAAYEPENRKLERWLIGVTTVGIMALLAPGLVVYADYIRAPRDALVVEVLGQQWQWRYRFPGPDGKLGKTDARFVNATNPFGLDPDDPAGHGNILVNGNELHLPLGQPVRVVLRSHDVLHDFYVPQFRARMNMVPGMVSTFWFKPSATGRYEVLCAQLCGVGHANMRGLVLVEEEASFREWLKTQPTFAMTMAAPQGAAGPGGSPDTPEARGRALAQSKGCVACHTADGSPGVGPTWKGLSGKTENMADGSTALVDDAYLREFIRNPQSRDIKGFSNIMPKIDVTDDELASLVAYIHSLGNPAAPASDAKR